MSLSWGDSSGTFGSTITLGSITTQTNQTSSLTISNIPVGATISDGHGNSFTATSGHQSVNIVGWFRTTNGSNLLYSSLSMTDVPSDADFTLTAINGAGKSDTDSVTVTPAAPTITSVTDNVAPLTGPVSNGGYTNDTTPSVQVSIANTGARVGDSIELFNGGNPLMSSSHAITAADIANGFVTLTTSKLANDTTYNITAVITDQDGNHGHSETATSSAFTINEQTTAPTEAVPSHRQTDNWTNSNSEGAGNLIFGTTHGNALTVSDHFSSETLTVTVSVGSGTFTLGSTNNVTVTNDGSSSVTIVGTASAINTALNNSTYHTTAHNTVSGNTDDTLTISATDQAGNNSSNSVSIDVICFMPGTLIRTPKGDVSVENLEPDDLVCTTDGRTVRVNWIGRQTVSTIFGNKIRILPIRIKAGALAENVPSRDLLISPDHAVLFDGALVQAGALVNGTSIVREQNVPKIFTYYHVEVDDHSLILAENTPAETFVDNIDRMNFDNWAEYLALYPEGKAIAELPYPRAKSHRQVPVSMRVMLAMRAQAIGAAELVAAVA